MAEHDLSAIGGSRANATASADRSSIVALAGFAALAIVWTWPVAAHLTTRIPHDLGDPLLNTWILWWNAHALPFTGQWWNPPVLWPMPGALALSEHLLGLSVVATPLQFAGANAIAAYNVCLLLSYALSGFFAYLLATRLTGSRAAGVCAGLAFGFSPHRAGQLAHLQVLASQWMPLVLLSLHGYLETGARRWLVLFAAAWLLQALSNGYYLIIFPIVIALWLMWFVPWRTKWREGVAIVIVWIASSLPLVPILAKYRMVHTELGLGRTLSDARNFSAAASSFVQAPPLLALWPDGSAPNSELYLFPGLTIPLLPDRGGGCRRHVDPRDEDSARPADARRRSSTRARHSSCGPSHSVPATQALRRTCARTRSSPRFRDSASCARSRASQCRRHSAPLSRPPTHLICCGDPCHAGAWRSRRSSWPGSSSTASRRRCR